MFDPSFKNTLIIQVEIQSPLIKKLQVLNSRRTYGWLLFKKKETPYYLIYQEMTSISPKALTLFIHISLIYWKHIALNQ